MATNQEAQAPEFPTPVMSTLSREFSANARWFQKVSRAVVLIALAFIIISTCVSALHAQSPGFRLFGYRISTYTAIAAGFFLLASLIRLYRNVRNPERIWFGSRVLAERTKSLGWRYAVAGEPFQLSGIEPDAAIALYQRTLDKAAGEANEGGIRYHTPGANGEIHVITDWMRETRAQDLDARRAIYAEQRIRDQAHNYARRERRYSLAVVTSKWILYIIETFGAVLAALNALGIIQLDLVGVVGTIAAGIAAWVQFNQYTELSATYGAMAYRLAGYREQCLNNIPQWTEDRWADYVGMVEDVLDEEHGAWRHIVQEGAADPL